MPPLELRTLRPEDEPAFREAVQESRDEGRWTFAPGYEDTMTFAEYVRKNEQWSRGQELPAEFVPAHFYVGVVNGFVIGRLSLRHQLNDFLARVGGHIGYAVRPAFRRRGYATAMLRQSLPLAAALGLERVLLTCDVDNAGSRAVIERCGGLLENVTDDPTLEVQKCRYWIRTKA